VRYDGKMKNGLSIQTMNQGQIIDEGIFDPLFRNAKEMNGLRIELGSKVNSDTNSSLAIKVEPSILLENTDYL
jgi:hypothetical protein